MDSCNGLLKFVKLFFCIQLFLNQTNFSIKNTFDLIILKNYEIHVYLHPRLYP